MISRILESHQSIVLIRFWVLSLAFRSRPTGAWAPALVTGMYVSPSIMVLFMSNPSSSAPGTPAIITGCDSAKTLVFRTRIERSIIWMYGSMRSRMGAPVYRMGSLRSLK